MGTSEQKHKKYAAPWQIVLMAIGFVVMTPIYGLTVAIMASLFVVSPILEHFDKSKFENVDSFSRSMYDEFFNASHGAETWEYTKECTPDRTGWMETGKFLCSATSRTQVEISNVSEINRLNEKYMKIIDESTALKTRDFAVYYPTIFGKKFQVSSTIKSYDHKTANSVVCTYDIQLGQNDTNDNMDKHGDDIIGKTGRVTISFTCSDLARGDWYK